MRGAGGTTQLWETPLEGESGEEAQLCSCTAWKWEGSSWDVLGYPARAQGNARARQRPRCVRGSAGLREDFHPPSHEEFPSLRMGEATPPSPFPFPVKFRVVSLDKDLTPSNQKVRAGLGRGEVTRAPCTRRSQPWERCGSHLSPWECCPGQPCPGSCPRGRDALCCSGVQQGREGESRGHV